MQSRYNSIQRQIDSLLDLRIDGEIDQEEYRLKKAHLLRQKKILKESLSSIDRKSDNWLELTEKTFNFANHARYWFKYGSSKQKNQILKTIGTNMLLDNKNVLIQEHKPFLIMKETHRMIERDSQKLEQANNDGISINNDTVTLHFPNWLPGRDSNPEFLIQSQT